MPLSINNINKPTPIWFKRLSNAVSILSNGTIAILLALGFKDSSLIMLLLKIGLSTLMQTIGALLTDTPEDSTTK